MPFDIKFHPAERIIEVIYPAEPSLDDVAEYLTRMKDVIDAQKAPWFCLVDQRNAGTLREELLEQVRVANSYAVLHGMQRSARVVRDRVAAEQANAISGNQKYIHVTVRTFVDRPTAVAWLTSPAPQGGS
jgi:hypothetical protein